MTGIQLDLFTVILMVVLAFICGYSAGHKRGSDEVREAVSGIFQRIGDLGKNIGQAAEEAQKRREEAKKELNESWENLMQSIRERNKQDISQEEKGKETKE